MKVYVVVKDQGSYSDRTVWVVGVRTSLDEAKVLAELDRLAEWGRETENEVFLWGKDAEKSIEWRHEWRAPRQDDGPKVLVERPYGDPHRYNSGTYWIELHTTEEVE
jgi:hypothetical protein